MNNANIKHRFPLLLATLSLILAAFLLFGGRVIGRSNAAGSLDLNLELFASGFVSPVDIAFDPDTGTAFIVEKRGMIQRVDNGAPADSPFLDIEARVLDEDAEQGLLGLVFHPDYTNNRYLYVNYIDLDGNTVVSRFTANAQNTTADPDSEFMILSVEQPYINHNSGDLAFGPDGYLYIPLGDGGWFNDPENRGQNTLVLLGKILRIDVDGGSPYVVPANNPFVGDPNVLDEIWAIGVRNPWRVSFDRLTSEFYIADVGQYAWEEINVQPEGAGGQNYGWSCYEGMHENPDTNMPKCNPPEDYTMPVAEYGHVDGCAITGGFVYRGSQYPEMSGRYFLSDYCSGHFWDLYRDGMGDWILTRHDNLTNFGFVSFGEDNAGELYVANLNGEISHLVGGSPATATPTATATSNATATPTATATSTATAIATPTVTATSTPTATPQTTHFQTLPIIVNQQTSDG